MGGERGEMRLEIAEALEDPVEQRPAVERKRLAPGEQPVLRIARKAASSACEKSPSAERRRDGRKSEPTVSSRAPPPAAASTGAGERRDQRADARGWPLRRRRRPGRPASSGASASRDWRSLAPLLGRADRLRLDVAAEIFVRLPKQADDVEAHHSPPGPPSSL